MHSHISLISIHKLSSHLCPDLLNTAFLLGFPTKILYEFLISPRHATWPTHHILDLITLTILGETNKLRSSSLCSVLQPPTTLSLLGSNILLSILFSNTLKLWSALSVRDQVSYPYNTKGKMIILYILIYTGDWKTKDAEQNGSKHSHNLIFS